MKYKYNFIFYLAYESGLQMLSSIRGTNADEFNNGLYDCKNDIRVLENPAIYHLIQSVRSVALF